MNVLKKTKFKDDILTDKIAMSAFFNWLIAGARRMYTDPLILPKRVADATNEYKSEQDIYSRFVNSRLLFDESGKLGWKIYGKDLYGEFIDWCKEEEGIPPVSNKIFGLNVKKVIGVTKDRSGLYYSNYRLPPPSQPVFGNICPITLPPNNSKLQHPLGTIAI